MSKIGIVTVLYNSGKVLDDFFKTLEEQKFKDFALYIVDNASADDGLEKAHRLSEKASFPCIFFEEKENWGVAKGNNIGIRRALEDGCEYVLLSNNDVVLNPDTIQNLYQGIRDHNTKIGASKIYYADTGLLWYAGGSNTYFRGGTIHDGLQKEDEEKYSRYREVEYAPTCFLIVHKDVFGVVGLMDEKYFVYYDDTDFIWRCVHQNNFKISYIPDSTLLHKESASADSVGSDFKIYYLNRNARYFAMKNLRGARKALTLLYNNLHNVLIKPITHSKHQREVCRKAISDSKNLLK